MLSGTEATLGQILHFYICQVVLSSPDISISAGSEVPWGGRRPGCRKAGSFSGSGV